MWWLSTLLALLLLCPAYSTECVDDVPADCEFSNTDDRFCGWKHQNWKLDQSHNPKDWYAYLSNDTLSGYMKSKERCVSSHMSHCLRFRFRLGRDKNRLNVSISWPANNTQSLLWTYSNQTYWTNASVPVRSASSFTLTISARSLITTHSRDISVAYLKYETSSCDILPSSAKPPATDPPTMKSTTPSPLPPAISPPTTTQLKIISGSETAAPLINTTDGSFASGEIPSGVALSPDVAVIVGVVAAILVIIASIVTIVVALRRRNALCARVSPGACVGGTDHDELSEDNFETQLADTRTTTGLHVNDDSTHANTRGELYVNQFPVTQRPLQSSGQRYRDSEGYETPCPRQGNAQDRAFIDVGRPVGQDARTVGQHRHEQMNLESRYRDVSEIPSQGTAAWQNRDNASVIFTSNQDRPISDVYEISSEGTNDGRQCHYQAGTVRQNVDEQMNLESHFSEIPPQGTVAEQSWDLASVTLPSGQGRIISDVYEISPDGANNVNRRQRDYQDVGSVLQTSTTTHGRLDCPEPDRSVHTGLRVDSPAQTSAGGASVYEPLQEQKDVHVYNQMPGVYQN